MGLRLVLQLALSRLTRLSRSVETIGQRQPRAEAGAQPDDTPLEPPRVPREGWRRGRWSSCRAPPGVRVCMEGHTKKEARRVLKRHLSDVIHRRMVRDLAAHPAQPLLVAQPRAGAAQSRVARQGRAKRAA